MRKHGSLLSISVSAGCDQFWKDRGHDVLTFKSAINDGAESGSAQKKKAIREEAAAEAVAEELEGSWECE